MSYQAGSAISYYILDISDAERKAAQLRSIYQGIRQDAASLATPVVAQSSGGSTTAVQTQVTVLQQAAVATGIYATATQELIANTIELGAAQGLTTDQINAQLAAMSRQALAAGDLAAANELQDAALGQQVLLIEADTAAVVTNTEAQEANSASKQKLGPILNSIVGPLALFTVGVGAAKTILDDFGNALHLAGQLQEEQTAFGGIIGDFDRGNKIIELATQNAKAYGFTQQQVTEAFEKLAPIIKESTASINDQAGSLERISVLNPANPVQALQSAIEGIKSGRVLELRRELGLSKEATSALVQSVQNGEDVFIALNHTLDANGVTLAVAKDRMDGYAGAERRAAQAQEDLSKAQASFGNTIGTSLIQEQTTLLTGLTRLLNGDLTTGFKATITNQNAAIAAQRAYSDALVNGKTQVEANQAAQQAFNNALTQNTSAQDAYNSAIQHGATAVQAHKAYTDALAKSADVSTNALQREADADERYTGATYRAVIATDALTHAQYQQNQQSLQDQRAGERSGGLFDTIDQVTSAYGKQHASATQAYQDAQNLRDAQLQYARSQDDTATQRKILNAELKDAAGDEAKQLTIKAQINELDKKKNTASKGLSGLDRTDIKLAGDYQDQLNEVNRRLANGHLTQQQRNQLLLDQIDLQNKINDAVQKEQDLQIGIGLDQVHNQQKLIEENAELAGLRRAETDSRFTTEQQQAIHLREQEILLDQQKRANDLAKAQGELGKTVKTSGIGAVPQGATGTQAPIGASVVLPIGSGLPVASGGVPQVSLAPGEKFVINLTVNVDKNGVATAVQTDPSVALHLIGKAIGIQSASGGFP